ncbi:hypothetical protein [Conexibacter sp. CPCC 206217]|uniref:hypothetical protein n=1 Tax=Conexibacter sp. CPCC 206217 TaxID=3064574 RepID=UPI002726E6DF|nr:hypothetical protein [Conexibacter sp. CPCC 206217]MDO8209878.1 hypothetical protein [Conexibacter sp. CPCC 206217]
MALQAAESPTGVLSPLWSQIAAGAVERDRSARFPTEAFEALGAAGVLGARGRVAEWALVRAAARVDGSVARILDGHFNAAERLDLLAPPALRMRDLADVAAGRLWLGVWGADPAQPHEGEPARLGPDGRVRGTKLFCSGAGGVQRALVTVRGGADADTPPLLVYLDVRERPGDGVTIDRSWFHGAGMRASESHRVVFDGVEPLAVLGEPGELGREPWFSRDAMRTAATWVGLADAIVDAALGALAQRPVIGELEAHAAGRLQTARGTCDAWIALAARRADAGDDLRETSIAYRAAIAGAVRTILDTAAAACGTRPFAEGELLDRARRDLELFLHQHRLDPLLARLGRARLEQLR